MSIVQKVLIELKVPKDTVFRDADHGAIDTFIHEQLARYFVTRAKIKDGFNIKPLRDGHKPAHVILPNGRFIENYETTDVILTRKD